MSKVSILVMERNGEIAGQSRKRFLERPHGKHEKGGPLIPLALPTWLTWMTGLPDLGTTRRLRSCGLDKLPGL